MVSLLDDGLQAGAMGLSVEPLRQGPCAEAGARLLRRRRRVPRVVRSRRPAPPGDRADDHPVQRSRARRRGRRALRPTVSRARTSAAQWPGMPMNVRDDDHASTGVVGRPPPSAGRAAATSGRWCRSSRWRRSSASSARSCSSACRPGTSWSTAPTTPSCRLLADPAWRDPRPADWDAPHALVSSPGSTARTRCSLAISETGAGPLDFSLAGLRRAARPAHLRRTGRVGARQRHPLDHGRHARGAGRGRHRRRAARAAHHLEHQRQWRTPPAVLRRGRAPLPPDPLRARPGSCSASKKRCTCSPAAPRRSSASPTEA